MAGFLWWMGVGVGTLMLRQAQHEGSIREGLILSLSKDEALPENANARRRVSRAGADRTA